MGITINITAGSDEATSSVSASGQIRHIITDTERKTFGIEDDGLKTAVDKYFGRRPNDAYLHSPTPWGDLYKTYGWDQVETVLDVKNATITGITSEPVIVSTNTFTNNSSVGGTFNVGITDQVTNTATHTWSETNTIEVSQTISYNIGFLGTGGGGETSMSYQHSWGQETTESKTVTVGSSAGVSVYLEPGQSVEAVLTASRGVLKVRIVYKAHLEGQTAVNYNPPHRDHHFWGLDINAVMNAAGLSRTREFTEDIEVGYYSNVTVEIRDPQGKTITTLPLADRPGIKPVAIPTAMR